MEFFYSAFEVLYFERDTSIGMFLEFDCDHSQKLLLMPRKCFLDIVTKLFFFCFLRQEIFFWHRNRFHAVRKINSCCKKNNS